MRKRILQVLAVVAVLVVGVLVLGALQPRDYHVERSAHIDAPRAKVFAVISDMNRFGEWSPWSKLDPNLQVRVENGPDGRGVRYEWTGNDDVGRGAMAIRDTLESERVDVALSFFEPWESKSSVVWVLAPEGSGTKITWSMDGKSDSVIARTFGLFMNMDKMIGKDFAEGLNRLKHVVEAG